MAERIAMDNEIILSIYVPVYNHQDYIVRALDGILMQKTKYRYDVWVGEDCSTDNTREILKAYEKEHPGKLNILYREHNMHSSEIRNTDELKTHCKGKYIICLEGDDFWTDENKLEKQIDFLENHPEYVAVAHNCTVVGRDSQPNGESYPECKDEEYTLEHFANNILPGQMTTVMFRNCYDKEIFDTSLVRTRLHIGDRCLYFSLITNGRIFCMQESMSAYRFVTEGGSSHAATYKYDYGKEKKYYLALIDYANRIKDDKALRCAEILFATGIISGIRRKGVSLSTGLGDLMHLKHKFTVIRAIFQKAFSGKARLK